MSISTGKWTELQSRLETEQAPNAIWEAWQAKVAHLPPPERAKATTVLLRLMKKRAERQKAAAARSA